MNLVFDAGAIIALLRAEVGSDEVERLITTEGNTSSIHAINLMEVYYDFRRSDGEGAAQDILRTVATLGLTVHEDMDQAFWLDAGSIKADHRRVSIADCFGIALARRLRGEFVTADHREFDPLLPLALCPIHFFR